MSESSLAEQEQIVSTLVKAGLDSLSETEKGKLSKVLFPDTHTDTILFAGEKRTLRPVPVKYSKMLHAAMMPFAVRAMDAEKQNKVFEGDEPLVEALKTVAEVLAKYYAWGEDVLKKIKEDDLMIDELQNLAVVQQSLNGSNDFLLAPLRLAVKIMQVRALMDVAVNKLQTTDQASMSNQNSVTTPLSSESGTAALTN